MNVRAPWFLSFALFFALTAASPRAHALFEVRLHGGMNWVNPEDLNTVLYDLGVKKVHSVTSWGIDGLVSLTGVPIGFGVRYEINETSSSQESPTHGRYDYELGFSRIALLVNHRLIDTHIYLGPLAGVGITNRVYFKERRLGDTYDYLTVGGTSVSLGVEGGLKAGSLIIGGELGYLFASFKAPKALGAELRNNYGDRVGLDFTGPYAKIHLGIHF